MTHILVNGTRFSSGEGLGSPKTGWKLRDEGQRCTIPSLTFALFTLPFLLMKSLDPLSFRLLHMSIPSSDSPEDPAVFEDAQCLLPAPVPSPLPTDSFWGHFQSPLNEDQLQRAGLAQHPYSMSL